MCGYFQQRCTEEFGYPADAFAYADVPISTSVFHDGDLDDATRQRYRCDVCFVSNASAPMERLHADLLREHPEMLQPMLEHLYAQIAAALGRDDHPRLSDLAGQLVSHAAEDFGITLNPVDARSLTIHYAYRLLD